MLEIRFTLDATPELIGSLRDIADAIHSVSNHAPTLASDAMRGDTREEKDGAAEKAQNLTAEAPVDGGHPEPSEDVEEPKKRKSRAKKAPSEIGSPVSPAIGDNLSPACACAEPEPAPPEETPAPEPAPETAQGPAPAPEKDMSGKGEKGEILSDLTRRALAELDEAGVAREESNRRIRDYGIRHGLKFPSFTALVQILGYADAVAVAKGEFDE